MISCCCLFGLALPASLPQVQFISIYVIHNIMLYLTLRQYEYVCAVARHGSLMAAAHALNVSQPALSAAIARIEDRLGYALFLRRAGAPMAPTPQGQIFTQSAQDILERAARLEHSAEIPPVRKRLVLGCFDDLAPFYLAPLLRLLRTGLPEAELHFRTGDFQQMTDLLLNCEVDLALSYDLGLDAGFKRSLLCQMSPHALMAPSHPLAQRAAVSLRDLATEPLILSRDGFSLQHMLSLFKSADLSPVIAHRVTSLELMRSLAANCEGIGLSYSLPPGDLTYDGSPLVSLPIRDSAALAPIILASHQDLDAAVLTTQARALILQKLGQTDI